MFINFNVRFRKFVKNFYNAKFGYKSFNIEAIYLKHYLCPGTTKYVKSFYSYFYERIGSIHLEWYL